MTHDEHLAAVADQLHQGVGRDTGTNLASAVSFLGAAAEEGKVQTVLDHSLVTATAEGHFDGQRCEIVAFLKILAIHTQTDGNGSSQTGRIDDTMHILQHGEFVLHCIIQVPLFKHQQITVTLHLTQQTVINLCPGGDGIIDICVHGGNRAVRQVHGQLFIVIHQNDGHDGTGTDVFIPHLVHLRHIAEVNHAHHHTGMLLRMYQSAIDPIAAGTEFHIVRIFALAVGQPFHADAGQKLVNGLFRQSLFHAGQGHETIAGPNHAVITQTDHSHGQRAFGAIGGKIRGFKSLLNEGVDLPVAALAGYHINDGHDGGQRQTCAGKIEIFHDCRRHTEQEHHNETATITGLESPSGFFIHNTRLQNGYFYP